MGQGLLVAAKSPLDDAEIPQRAGLADAAADRSEQRQRPPEMSGRFPVAVLIQLHYAEAVQ